MMGRNSNRTFNGSRPKGHEIILYRLKRSFLYGPKSRGMIQLHAWPPWNHIFTRKTEHIKTVIWSITQIV